MPATKRDYYEVLGIGRGSDGAEVKRAFRIRARVMHPDVSDDPEANEKFAELAEAYDVLSKSTSRLLYDRFGYRGRGEFAAVEPRTEQLFDFLEATAQPARRRPGGEVHVTEQEAERGARKTIEYKVVGACGACDGSGAAAGSEVRRCTRCGGRGRTRHGSTLAGDHMLQIDTCLKCGGRGTIVSSPCRSCDGSGRSAMRKRAEIVIPARAAEGQRVVVGDGDSTYVVLRIRMLRDAAMIRYGSLAGLLTACLFLVLVLR
jgi:molecular chaperone DnaJ